MTDAAAPSRNYWRIAGVTLTFIWFFVGGIGHFVITKTFTSVVPPYIPFPREMVYLTGVCEIAGALALLYKPLRSIAGIMLALLAICVTPVHIQMLIEADKYAALGPPILWGRLILQPFVIWIFWWSTRAVPATTAHPKGSSAQGQAFIFADNEDHLEMEGAFKGTMPLGVVGVDQLMKAVATALEFPGYFGENWNALYDCLCDFSWIEQENIYLVHREIPKIDPDDLKLYVGILRDAAEGWKVGQAHQLVVVFPTTSEEAIRGPLR